MKKPIYTSIRRYIGKMNPDVISHFFFLFAAFLSWDVTESGIDIERELAIVTALSPEGDFAKNGKCYDSLRTKTVLQNMIHLSTSIFLIYNLHHAILINVLLIELMFERSILGQISIRKFSSIAIILIR